MNRGRSLARLALAITAIVTLTACGGSPDPAPTPTPTSTDGEPTSSPDQSPTASPDSSPTSTPSPDEGALALTNSCTNPEGFSVSYPSSWFTNDGSVVSACSQFSPERFQVPAGTDERVAPITIFIDPVPFFRAAAPGEDTEQSRATTVLDGRQAVRIAKTASGQAFWPEGTRQTTYLVDLSTGPDPEGRARTLFIDTVSVGDFDYQANVRILDRMARTLDITTGEEPENADRAVARYEGGGGAFTVVAQAADNQVCLRIPPEGEQACVEAPGSEGIDTVELQLLGPRNVLAGAAGVEVFRVDARQADGNTVSYLPAPVRDSQYRGWALPGNAAEVEELIWFGLDGSELGREATG